MIEKKLTNEKWSSSVHVLFFSSHSTLCNQVFLVQMTDQRLGRLIYMIFKSIVFINRVYAMDVSES
jgi:hypothetical protein